MAGIYGDYWVRSFSKRQGLVVEPTELSLSAMPTSLRNGLWDTVKLHYFDDLGTDGSYNSSPRYSEKFGYYSYRLQFDFFRESIDDLPRLPSQYLAQLRTEFFSFQYNDVYDFIEFLILNNNQDFYDCYAEDFVQHCNLIFERERAQVRVAGSKLILVTAKEELEEISKSITNDQSEAVATHIAAAAALYSQRPSPDYRNSIKEAISAVESAVRFVTGKKTSGVAKPLKLIESEFRIHPALRDGFEKLFAYTSDAEGVRHALTEQSTVTQADAKFMLVACSAFANYLLTLKSLGKDQ